MRLLWRSCGTCRNLQVRFRFRKCLCNENDQLNLFFTFVTTGYFDKSGFVTKILMDLISILLMSDKPVGSCIFFRNWLLVNTVVVFFNCLSAWEDLLHDCIWSHISSRICQAKLIALVRDLKGMSKTRDANTRKLWVGVLVLYQVPFEHSWMLTL